jgi:hypothetical protein
MTAEACVEEAMKYLQATLKGSDRGMLENLEAASDLIRMAIQEISREFEVDA